MGMVATHVCLEKKGLTEGWQNLSRILVSLCTNQDNETKPILREINSGQNIFPYPGLRLHLILNDLLAAK